MRRSEIKAQLRLTSQVKLGAKLNKIKIRILVINFGRDFGRTFMFFVKSLLD